MSLEAPTSGNLPWMVRAPLNEWIEFEVKIQTLEKTENDKGWSCYTGQMQNIDMKGVADGDYEIPFWAMEPFFEAYEELNEVKGWFTFSYRRTEVAGKNIASFRVV